MTEPKLQKTAFLLLLHALILIPYTVTADHYAYQTSFLVKVRIHPQNTPADSFHTGYIRHVQREFTITDDDSSFALLPELFLRNVKDNGFHITKDSLLVGDSLHQLVFNDTVLTDYLAGRMIDLDDVDSIVSDSALYGDWGGTESWVAPATGAVLRSSEVVFNDTVWIENGGYMFLHLVGLDSSWSKEKLNSLIDAEVFQNSPGPESDRELIAKFHPQIQKAIEERKLFFFTTFSP